MKEKEQHTKSKFKVQRYSHLDARTWNDFIATSKNATFLFHRAFMDYHKDRFEDFSLMIYNKDKLVALLPANRVGDEIHSHQGLTYGGLLLQLDCFFEDVLNSFKAVLKFLNDISVKNLHLKLLPKIYHHLPSDEIDYLVFIVGGEISRRDLSETIDLSKYVKLTSSNRVRGLKRAVKKGLIVKEVDYFDDFWIDVLTPNLRDQFQVDPVHSLKEIELLKSNFPKQIRQFNVYNGIKLVAGVTIFETEKVAHAQYISANLDKQELGSLDIVFNHLINDVFKNKSYFDFGISNEKEGRIINKGLLSWKESFKANPIIHDFYSIKTENYKLLDGVLK